jgi:hypothetical protein
MAMRCKYFLAVMALLVAASPALAQEDKRAGNPEPAKLAQHAAPKKIIKRHAKTASVKPAARMKRAVAAKTVKTPLPPLPPKREVAKAEPTPLPLPKPDAAKVEPKTPLPQPKPEVAKLEPTAPLPPPKPDAAKVDEKTPLPVPRPAAVKAEPEKAPAKPELAKTVAQPEPAAAAFGAIVPDERSRIQAALAWAGDLSNDAKGEEPFTAAIKSYQKRNKAKSTGALTPDQRSALLASARAHETEFGWSVMADPATGIRIGLPTKLVPQVHDAARGTRWSSAHGEFQIETFRIKGPDLKLAALFEQHKNEPNRKVANSALHDDNFFISGMQGLKDFSVRAQMRDGEIRGFTLMYDQAWQGIVAPVTGAVVSSFAPFPERGVPYAPLAKSVEYGSGLIVSPRGDIVTARKLTEGCKVILVPGLGNVEHVADDATSGLALLRVYGRGKLTPLALSNDAPKAGEVTLIGVPDPKEQSGPRPFAEVKAQLAGSGAIELRRPMPVAGLAGGAALDAQARVLGMVDMRNAVLASAEATAAPVRLVSAATIRDFLSRHRVTPASAPGGDARDSIVRVVCVRK